MPQLRNAQILFALRKLAEKPASAVDVQQEPSVPAPPPTSETQSLLDINTASVEEIEALPVIGAVLATKILAAREASAFADFNDFKTRLSLTKKQASELEPLVSFS